MKDVIIKIKGTQVNHNENDENVIEFSTDGKLESIEDGVCLYYDESELLGAENCRSSLSVLKDRSVVLERTGDMNSRLVIEADKRNNCFYDTPYGSMKIGIYGELIESTLNENGGEHIQIISKIENRSGVENLKEIIDVSDGVMVARGDLGVEISFDELPAIQKKIISACYRQGKHVVTATQMLESMTTNPLPTRAEVSDVANAVYDGTSAVMLSGESAAGEYPVAAVKNMAEIAEFTEKGIDYISWFQKNDYEIHNNLDAISHGTCAMAIDVKAKCIVVSSLSGTTARMVSRFRCPVDIVGMTTSEKVWRKLNMSWAVTPVLSEEFNSQDVMFYHGVQCAKKICSLKKGDSLVLTGGQINGKTGNTNTIKIETIS